MRFHETLAVSGVVHAGLAAAQTVYADNQVPVIQDEDHVAVNFPEIEDVLLYSPAFVRPEFVRPGFANGTAPPVTDDVVDNYLQTLASRNDWMNYVNPPFKSEEGRSLPYVYLSSSHPPSVSAGSILASHANVTKPTDKVRIWMQGGVHGNEPAGDHALLELLGKLDANVTWAESILDKVDILMLPRYNPDGVAYFQRFQATSFDPNRDHTKMASQQTRDIKKLVMDFAPHVGVDCHEYTATRPYGAQGQWTAAQDGQFSAMKNLNIHQDIRELSETLFADSIAHAMESNNMTWSPYVIGPLETDDLVLDETSSDAKIGDTSVGLSQAIMFLTETRGIRLADQHFQRRTVTGLVMVEALVQTAADNAELVYRTVEDARADFIAGDAEIVITDSARETEIDWTFINTFNGSVVDVPVTFMNTTPLNANLTRPRPEAYIFSRAWPDVAARLRAAGVVVDELRAPFRGEVVAYNVTGAELATSKYEGIVRTTVTTETFSKNVTIPAGGFWVSTRQKNAAHAFNVFEPENIDSYATFNIFPVDVADEYQVYRVMK